MTQHATVTFRETTARQDFPALQEFQ